jgi:hypothetical protein
MLLAYGIMSRYIVVLSQDHSSTLDGLKFKKALAILAFITKYGIIIGFFVIFFIHSESLRYWIGSICFILGLEALWTALPRRNPFTSGSPLTKRLLISSTLLIVAVVLLFLTNKMYVYLSVWDLMGVIVFLVCTDAAGEVALNSLRTPSPSEN